MPDAPIYVEVFSLLHPKLTGVGRLSARLIEALHRRTPLRLTTFIDPRSAFEANLCRDLQCGQELAIEKDELGEAGNDLTGWVRDLCHRPKRPFDRVAAASGAGVFTSWRPAERHFGLEVGILHDFTPLIVPTTHVPQMRREFIEQVRRATKYDKAIANSQSTRGDAIWLSPLDEENISYAYPGPSQCVRDHASAQEVRRSENIMLVVGTKEPRKNGAFLLDWFLNSSAVDDRAEVWWAGPDGWLWEARMPRAQRSRIKRVKFLGMVSDAELCRLYRQARLTIYPSLYEGFGFPVVDSLRHETPVLCSYNSSLAELEHPGVFYFDACDASTLDEAYRELTARSPHAIPQTSLAQRYSWDNFADTVLRVVRGAAAVDRAEELAAPLPAPAANVSAGDDRLKHAA